MRWIYLALAIWGSIHPMFYFMSWLSANDWSLSGLIDAWYVNDSTTGLVWDLTIAAIALTIWVVVESVQRRNFWGLLAVPTIYCIGVSCGLPFYLFLRMRRTNQAA